MDFTNAFSLADLADNFYINLPPIYGHDSLSKKDLVLKLNKSLYGLVQAPRCWYDKLSSELGQIGFKTSDMDQCLFYKEKISALVYFDDVIFFGKDLRNIDKVIDELKAKKLPLTVEKNVFHFLGIDIERVGDDKTILHQVELIDKFLKTVGMNDCHAKETPELSMPVTINDSGE